jgi:hypothetical protein
MEGGGYAHASISQRNGTQLYIYVLNKNNKTLMRILVHRHGSSLAANVDRNATRIVIWCRGIDRAHALPLMLVRKQDSHRGSVALRASIGNVFHAYEPKFIVHDN